MMNKFHQDCRNAAKDKFAPEVPSVLECLHKRIQGPSFHPSNKNPPRCLLGKQDWSVHSRCHGRVFSFNEESHCEIHALSSKTSEWSWAAGLQKSPPKSLSNNSLVAHSLDSGESPLSSKLALSTAFEAWRHRRSEKIMLDKVSDALLASKDCWMEVPEPTPLPDNRSFSKPDSSTPQAYNVIPPASTVTTEAQADRSCGKINVDTTKRTLLDSNGMWAHVPEPTPLLSFAQMKDGTSGFAASHMPVFHGQFVFQKTHTVTTSATPSIHCRKDPDSTSTNDRLRRHHQDKWNQHYQSLIEFRERYGHCNVPHGCPEYPALARWVKRQRHQYRIKLGECGQTQSSSSTMTLDRFQRLHAIGFEWKRHESLWQTRFEELVEFRRLHGHASVPSEYHQNPKLALWVKQQRRQYRKMSQGQLSTMTLEKIELLQSVGFGWSLRLRRK